MTYKSCLSAIADTRCVLQALSQPIIFGVFIPPTSRPAPAERRFTRMPAWMRSSSS
ncbi:hypothetical protein M378DRAFT_847525 [Amanita muscaria Koide BX008]|uniref:Uncharacterized protein n=1 Tax=Amanita muscaria (strain Koide BX008) TaxID=946122 RepID=A0A0C2WZ22_AMAMK|nr:hypothetical protein M378DRAFT_847525 [Amanita muscaria Koide BX008]